MKIKDEKKIMKYEIPVEGSLGLLALGAVGIKAWRDKRKEEGYIVENTNILKKEKEEKPGE